MTTLHKGIALVIAGAVIGFVASMMMGGQLFGGVYNQITQDFSQGISVAGTTVIDSARNVTAAIASFSGLVTLNGGQLNSYPNATTTMSGTETLVLADVANYDVVLLTPNVIGNTTLTLFASSTATTWLPTAGDRQKVCFVNATTTANVTYTFAGGTGTTLLVASSSISALGSKLILPQKMGCFDFVRASATATTFDILGSFTSFQ